MDGNIRILKHVSIRCDECENTTKLSIKGVSNNEVFLKYGGDWFISTEKIMCPDCMSSQVPLYNVRVSLESKYIELYKINGSKEKWLSRLGKLDLDDLVYSNTLESALEELQKSAEVASQSEELDSDYVSVIKYLSCKKAEADLCGISLEERLKESGFFLNIPQSTALDYKYILRVSFIYKRVQLVDVFDTKRTLDFRSADLDFSNPTNFSNLTEAVTDYVNKRISAYKSGTLPEEITRRVYFLEDWVNKAKGRGIFIEEYLKSLGYDLDLPGDESEELFSQQNLVMTGAPTKDSLESLAKSVSAIDILSNISKEKESKETVFGHKLKQIAFYTDKEYMMRELREVINYHLSLSGLDNIVALSHEATTVYLRPKDDFEDTLWTFLYEDIHKLKLEDYLDEQSKYVNLQIYFYCEDGDFAKWTYEVLWQNFRHLLGGSADTTLYKVEMCRDNIIYLHVCGEIPKVIYDTLTYKRIK